MVGYLLRRLLLAVVTIVTVSFGAFVCFGTYLDPSYPLVLSPDQRPRHLVQAYYHLDRKSTRLNSSHIQKSRMPSSA